jgi:hypothetical protein
MIVFPIDSQQRSDNAAAVAALEQTYYSPKTLKRLDEGKSIPGDPYRRQWNNVDTASIFAAVKGQRLYEDIYRNASDRIHWSPRSIFLALETEESGARIYMADDPRMAATALAASFHSLFQTMEAVDIYFELGHAERLAKIRNEYAKNLSEALE